MVSASTALIASAVVSTAATAYSFYEQDKAADKAKAAQEEAKRTSQASAQVENARQRRRAIAQARVAAAQNQANVGEQVQTSSALTGVQAGLGTQLGANLGAQQQRVNTQNRIMDLNQRSTNALQRGRMRSAMVEGVGNLASSGLDLYASDFAPKPRYNPNPYSEQFLPTNF